jgi:hypothetical protein
MYKKGQLQITERCAEPATEWHEVPEYGHHYHVYGHFEIFPYAVAYLPHSCDEWVIGGPEQIQALIDDLTEALKALSAQQPIGGEMNWTTEYPTRPGYYWICNWQMSNWRNSVTTMAPTVVEVDTDGDFYHIGSEETQFKHRVISAEWYGPIQPPEP